MIARSASPLDETVVAYSRCSSFSSRAEQQPAHADDGVHRRADLVAHRRQERALGLVRCVGAPTCLLELGHVVVDPVVPLVLTVDDERHDVDLDLDEPAVGPHPTGQSVRAALLQRLADDRLALIGILGRLDHQRVDRAADRVLRRVPEQMLRRRVPAGHHLVPIHRDDRDRTDVDERFEVLLLRADLLEQTRGLDRDRRLLRETDEEVEVLIREEVGGGGTPDGHHPDDAPASQERGRHQALLVLLLRTRDADGTRIAGEVVHDLGAPRLARSPITPSPMRIASAMIELGDDADRHEGEVPIRTRTFLQEDRARVGLQQILRPFADPSDHRVEFEETSTSRPSSASAAISVPRR